MRAEFHPEAELELIEAASYYDNILKLDLILTTNSVGSFSTVFRIR